jgi:hypothetical protein
VPVTHSSNRLVISRATPASRSPKPSASAASVTLSRGPDSYRISVARTVATSAIAVARAPALGGRKPRNRNRSVGSPASVSAATAAHGPGTVTTACPAARASRTSLKPGSEISGVPASDTSATTSRPIRATRPGRTCSAL